VLLLLAALPARAEDDADDPSLVVFLVRHAEKATTSPDPLLTEAGQERARQLARLLRDAGIGCVHSSDYVRTRDTAAPFAAGAGLQVELYDPGKPAEMAKALKGAGGRHLVVGHSNTTRPLVEALGGDAGPEIDERWEYDRLYVVTVSAEGSVSTVLLRYGPPNPAH